MFRGEHFCAQSECLVSNSFLKKKLEAKNDKKGQKIISGMGVFWRSEKR